MPRTRSDAAISQEEERIERPSCSSVRMASPAHTAVRRPSMSAAMPETAEPSAMPQNTQLESTPSSIGSSGSSVRSDCISHGITAAVDAHAANVLAHESHCRKWKGASGKPATRSPTSVASSIGPAD